MDVHREFPLAGTNPLPVHLMAPEQRLHELAQILAAGLLRLRKKEKARAGNDLRDYRLDFPPTRSGHADANRGRRRGA